MRKEPTNKQGDISDAEVRTCNTYSSSTSRVTWITPLLPSFANSRISTPRAIDPYAHLMHLQRSSSLTRTLTTARRSTLSTSSRLNVSLVTIRRHGLPFPSPPTPGVRLLPSPKRFHTSSLTSMNSSMSGLKSSALFVELGSIPLPVAGRFVDGSSSSPFRPALPRSLLTFFKLCRLLTQ